MTQNKEPAISAAFYHQAFAFEESYGRPLPNRVLRLGDEELGFHILFNNTDRYWRELSPLSSMVSIDGMSIGLFGPTGGAFMSSGEEDSTEDMLIEWLKEQYVDHANETPSC